MIFLINFLGSLIAGIALFFLGLYWNSIVLLFRGTRRHFLAFFGIPPHRKPSLVITVDTFQDTRKLSLPFRSIIYSGKHSAWGETEPLYARGMTTHSTGITGPSYGLTGWCSTRGALYLQTAFSEISSNTILITSDEEMISKMQGTFINIGGSGSNSKTDFIKKEAGNKWLKDDFRNQLELKDGKRFSLQNGHDHGYILKIPNRTEPNRWLISCAGIGDWGTSGAAWYLAEHWEDLYKKYGTRSFLIILKVMFGNDHTAMEVASYSDD